MDTPAYGSLQTVPLTARGMLTSSRAKEAVLTAKAKHKPNPRTRPDQLSGALLALALPALALPASALLTFAPAVQAETVAGPVAKNSFSLGGGISVGANLEKNANFRGWTLDYGTGLGNGWSFTFSLAYDKETERQSGKPDKVTQSYTPTLIWSKPINQRWSVFTGIAKGLFDDSEKKGSYELTDLNADWATGIGLSYLLYRSGPHVFSMSGTLEYKINDDEFAVSSDLGYAYFF